MMYQIEYAYTCHMGRVRANNEDNLWCCGESLPADNQGMEGVHSQIVSGLKTPAMAVFDGMGGESCGEMAAFLASDEFGRYYRANRRTLRDIPELFIDGVCESMNQAVCRYAAENHIQSMGTTLAMTLFTPESMFVCNLGDSRIYFSDEKSFRQVSTDHILGKGGLGKAPLTQYLGVPEEQQKLEPAVLEIEHKEGNRYLLCSDGVTDMLSDGEIADILSRKNSLRETVELLLDRALQKGGRDNATIILCEVQKQELKGKFKAWLKSIKEKNEG